MTSFGRDKVLGGKMKCNPTAGPACANAPCSGLVCPWNTEAPRYIQSCGQPLIAKPGKGAFGAVVSWQHNRWGRENSSRKVTLMLACLSWLGLRQCLRDASSALVQKHLRNSTSFVFWWWRIKLTEEGGRDCKQDWAPLSLFKRGQHHSAFT